MYESLRCLLNGKFLKKFFRIFVDSLSENLPGCTLEFSQSIQIALFELITSFRRVRFMGLTFGSYFRVFTIGRSSKKLKKTFEYFFVLSDYREKFGSLY